MLLRGKHHLPNPCSLEAIETSNKQLKLQETQGHMHTLTNREPIRATSIQTRFTTLQDLHDLSGRNAKHGGRISGGWSEEVLELTSTAAT